MATYSVERLVHFRCDDPDCRRWWTIGDFVLEMYIAVHCPWCGMKQTFRHVHEKQP